MALDPMSATPKNSQDPGPGEIRRRILDDHEALRELLSGIEAISREVLGGSTDLVLELRGLIRSLHGKIRAHMALEEDLLLPLLCGVEWGEERAQLLVADHAAQRDWLDQSFQWAEDETVGARPLATHVQVLLEWLRRDMESEERELLDSAILSDERVGLS